MTTKFWAAVLMPLLASFSASSVNAQTMAIPPTMDCTFWAKVKNDRAGMAMVQGYLSGRSMGYWLQHTAKVGEHGVDPLAALSNMNDAYAWLDSYCVGKPREPIVLALDSLFADLEARRLLAPRKP